jgi:2-oxoglutarate/2-oxoacid ferredoxin oxidoreductase subunit beta
MPLADIDRYWRMDKLPHIWCPGCGNGIALQGVLRGIDALQLDQNKVVVVSGIGCSSRSAGYVDFNTLHTAHGRALPFATGVKLARPELTVFVITGDGDCAAIGGNHFIHAARRNIDLNVVVFNNSTYGMTSGQFSPLTPPGSTAATAPYGTLEPAFDLCRLAEAAGATYVARTTTFHIRQLPDLVVHAVRNKGFSLIEVVAGCPVYFGRMNRMADPVDLLKWQRQNAINPKQASILPPEELKGKFVIGELHHHEAPEYTESYAKLVETVVQQGAGDGAA